MNPSRALLWKACQRQAACLGGPDTNTRHKLSLRPVRSYWISESQKVRRRARNALSRRRPVLNWALQSQSLINVQWPCHDDMTVLTTPLFYGHESSPMPPPVHAGGPLVGTF
jgi:hypothetical protein